MTDKPTPASLRASAVLAELLSGENDYRTGLVVLSYRRPGAGESDVSYAHATGMRGEEGAIDFVMMAKVLRQIADQLDGYVKNPASLLEVAKGMNRR